MIAVTVFEGPIVVRTFTAPTWNSAERSAHAILVEDSRRHILFTGSEEHSLLRVWWKGRNERWSRPYATA